MLAWTTRKPCTSAGQWTAPGTAAEATARLAKSNTQVRTQTASRRSHCRGDGRSSRTRAATRRARSPASVAGPAASSERLRIRRRRIASAETQTACSTAGRLASSHAATAAAVTPANARAAAPTGSAPVAASPPAPSRIRQKKLSTPASSTAQVARPASTPCRRRRATAYASAPAPPTTGTVLPIAFCANVIDWTVAAGGRAPPTASSCRCSSAYRATATRPSSAAASTQPQDSSARTPAWAPADRTSGGSWYAVHPSAASISPHRSSVRRAMTVSSPGCRRALGPACFALDDRGSRGD